ncbi:MAG: hypothetical protein FWC82_03520, partial [Firmicutes bacterium]|nr:hypothetical protein [Bacillota bacterium]
REGTEPAYDADGYPDMNVDGTRRMVNYRVRERNSLFVTNENPILNRTIYGSGIYVLDFRFAEQGQPRHEIRIRDHSDEGERFKTIQFDRIRIAINDSQNEIRQYMMWIYDTDYVLSGEAYVTPVLIRMNTTRLFENLNQIRYLRRGDSDNGEFIPPRPPGDDLPDDDNGYDDWD